MPYRKLGSKQWEITLKPCLRSIDLPQTEAITSDRYFFNKRHYLNLAK